MKTTKSELRHIIREELKTLLKEEISPYDADVGDYLLVSVSNDERDVGVEIYKEEPELGYKNYSRSLLCVAQIVKMAERDPEDY